MFGCCADRTTVLVVVVVDGLMAAVAEEGEVGVGFVAYPRVGEVVDLDAAFLAANGAAGGVCSAELCAAGLPRGRVQVLGVSGVDWREGLGGTHIVILLRKRPLSAAKQGGGGHGSPGGLCGRHVHLVTGLRAYQGGRRISFDGRGYGVWVETPWPLIWVVVLFAAGYLVGWVVTFV